MMRYCSNDIDALGSQGFAGDDVDAAQEAERELRLARVLLAFHHSAAADFEEKRRYAHRRHGDRDIRLEHLVPVAPKRRHAEHPSERFHPLERHRAGDSEDDERVLHEAVAAGVEIHDEVSMILPQGHVCLGNPLSRESRLPGESLAEVHQVIGGGVDPAHSLESGRIGDGYEDDEPGHCRGIECFRHALNAPTHRRTRRRARRK